MPSSPPTRRHLRICLAAALAVAAGCGSAEARPFSPASVWNAPLSPDARLDRRSPALVQRLAGEVERELAQNAGPDINTANFSTTVYRVGAGRPTVRVHLDEPDRALQRAFARVPLPPGARASGGGDAQLTVWQPSGDTLWEFFELSRQPDGWHARAGGAMHRVSCNPGYYVPSSWPGARSWWGATATSLPLLGGLIRIGELRRGVIPHALAIGIPEVRAGAFAWPAERTDGASTARDAIPEGARFRLDPRLDLDALHLPPVTRMIAEAAQRYGMVVRDRSGDVSLYAETPRRGDPYPQLFRGLSPVEILRRFPWRHLQVPAIRWRTDASMRRAWSREARRRPGPCRRLGASGPLRSRGRTRPGRPPPAWGA